MPDVLVSRRSLLLGGAAVALTAVAAACSTDGDDAAERPARPSSPSTDAVDSGSLPLTPGCADDAVTPEQTEGPFFTPNSPEKTSFVADVGDGTLIVVAGTVLNTSCAPVANARLDVWHADDAGEYDNDGYRLRGHFFTDAAGRYRFETIVPGLYPGRTRHFHVKVRAPRGPLLTTQLYFPGERRNENDSIFHPELVMDVRDATGGREAAFDFVIET
jgi:protocatechuate 3,4-dioxygenase beta subunit